jgi:putative ABC transport system substrate-binding protein
VTGVNFLAADMGEKALALIHELLPNVTIGAILINPNNPNADSVTRNAREAARSLGLQFHLLTAGTAAEIDAAFASLVEQRIGMLLTGADPFSLAVAINSWRWQRGTQYLRFTSRANSSPPAA